ncbi:MAG: hypothetical protein H6706_15835 [Myxococcales bacterium]|nr:hypothetical protein [Myxococcales bacterium]
MALLISGFEGFGDADFDVYRPACWSNNLHNLDRMRTKARVKVLADRLLAAVGDAELVVEASSEIPSVWNGRQVRDQWAYLLRSDAARRRLQPVVARSVDLATRVKDPAEHHRHLLLAVRIDEAGVEVGLRIHQHATVDLANLLGRADRAGGELAALVAALPADVTLGGEAVTPAGLLAAARAAQRGEAEWLLVSRTWARADAIAAAAELAEAVVATAEALLPLFRFVAWTPDNDHVGVQEKLESIAEAVEHRKEEAEAARDAAAEEREARHQEARARTESRLAELKAWKQNLRVRRDEEPAAEAPAEQRARAEAPARRPPRRAAPPRRGPRPEAPRPWRPRRAPPVLEGGRLATSSRGRPPCP